MQIGEDIMKHYLGLCFGLLLAGYGCLAVADDMEKIRELEHAMTAPAAEITKKPRTRAIVTRRWTMKRRFGLI